MFKPLQSLPSPISTSNPPIHEKAGKVIVSAMLASIVMYHGLDSMRKLYKMGAEVDSKIKTYFEKKKEAVEADKAANIT